MKCRCHSNGLIFLGGLLFIVLLSSCSGDIKRPPLPVNGILNLRDWDFEKDGNFEMKGYWEFCFQEFLTASQFDTLREKNFAWVPGVWKRGYLPGVPGDTVEKNRLPWWPKLPWEKYYWEGVKLGGTGFASYRLTLLFATGQRNIAFKIKDEGTAYRFFIDDSLACSVGIVGTSEGTSEPQYHNRLLVLENPRDTTLLTVWVSNFHYRKGGLWKSIIIGSSDQLERAERNSFISSVFIAGIWVMVSFVLLSFFLYRPKERSVMFLMIWAFASLFRMISSDERLILDFFPGIDFELLVKMELMSLYAIVLAGTNTLFWLFPKETSRRLTNIFTLLLFVPLIITVFTKAHFHTNFVVPFQITALVVILYSNWVLVKAVARKREGALIIAIGFAIMSGIFFLQVPYYNQLTNFSINMYTSFAFIFAFIQVIFLAKMFSSALKKAENFAGELEVTVQERTRELVKTQEQLITAAKQTENEKIRRRISQDLHDDISSGLNKISWMGELVKIKAQNKKAEEMNIALDKIIHASRETVDHLIEIIWSMNPNNDDLENMLSFMRNYINKYFDDTEFNVVINFPEQLQKIELNPELKRNLFLVMKEALHNAAKYSNARNIKIDFRYQGHAYCFTIADDGIGIEEGVVKGTGNGMINMRKRMEEVQGSLRIESAVGKGTQVIVEGLIY